MRKEIESVRQNRDAKLQLAVPFPILTVEFLTRALPFLIVDAPVAKTKAEIGC